jgi:hypothetical protein
MNDHICGDPNASCDGDCVDSFNAAVAKYEQRPSNQRLLDHLIEAVTLQARVKEEFFISYAHQCAEMDRRAAVVWDAKNAVLAAMRPAVEPSEQQRPADEPLAYALRQVERCRNYPPDDRVDNEDTIVTLGDEIERIHRENAEIRNALELAREVIRIKGAAVEPSDARVEALQAALFECFCSYGDGPVHEERITRLLPNDGVTLDRFSKEIQLRHPWYGAAQPPTSAPTKLHEIWCGWRTSSRCNCGAHSNAATSEPPQPNASHEPCEHSPLFTYDSVGVEYRAPCPWCLQLELTRVVAERAAEPPLVDRLKKAEELLRECIDDADICDFAPMLGTEIYDFLYSTETKSE